VSSCGRVSFSRMTLLHGLNYLAKGVRVRAVFAEQIKFVLYLVKSENYKASIYVIFSIVRFPPVTYVQIF
jgi:hypothetical protein